MRQNLQPYGKSTSPRVGVVNLSTFGFWLYVEGQEFFMSFSQFPWFKKATVDQIRHIEREGHDHFHWPELDIDLNLERIKNPEKYPLVSR